MARSVLAMFFASVTLSAAMPAAATDAATTESCFYDEASAAFGSQSVAADSRGGLVGTMSNSQHLKGATVITIDGLRYLKANEGTETVAGLNAVAALGGTVEDVRFFRLRNDPYGEHVFLPNDPRNCSWISFQYRPEVHFAWIEEKSDFADGFLFKHPGLAVDPASFRKQGEYVRGIGFSIFGHPHKQDDGTQPRYHRTYIEADCAGKRLRLLDVRRYAADWKVIGFTRGSDEWFTADDVYPALSMQMHVMCEVPLDAWNEETRLPGTLDEFSDYIHALAHDKVE